jgi:hypothetical protein
VVSLLLRRGKSPFGLLLILVALLSSCRYSNNISLGVSFSEVVSDFTDSTKIAFISSQKAYRSAVGLAAFPDGGQSKYVYKANGLYVFDGGEDALIYLKDLTKPINPPWYARPNPRLVLKDNLLYYNCTLNILKSIDSLELIAIKKVFVECFSIDINTKKISPVDTLLFNELYSKYRISPAIGMLNRAKAHPLAEWGLILNEIYPKTDKQYIEYLIYGKNGGNAETNRAIIEQIVATKSKEEIKDIMRRMEDYKNSLEGYDKAKYEIGMEDAFKNIRKLL